MKKQMAILSNLLLPKPLDVKIVYYIYRKLKQCLNITVFRQINTNSYLL